MNGENGRGNVETSKRRNVKTGLMPVALAITLAVQKYLDMDDPNPVCVVIEMTELDHATQLWELMQSDFRGMEMSYEADQRTAGQRVVLLFRGVKCEG